MMNMLQAWEYLAKVWSSPQSLMYQYPLRRGKEIVCVYLNMACSLGLCTSIKSLLNLNLISKETASEMDKILHAHAPYINPNWRTEGYFWTPDAEGAKERAKFCQRVAKTISEQDSKEETPVTPDHIVDMSKDS